MFEPTQLHDEHEDTARSVAGVRLRSVRRDHGPDVGESRNVAAEQAVRDLLIALGQDPERSGLADTPRRVAASFTELLSPVEFTPTTFPNDEGYEDLVLARDIEFSSLC